jgi:hypothetical protein
VQRLPVASGEYVAGLAPDAAGQGVAALLSVAVLAQDLGGAPVEGDGAVAGRRLGRAFDDLAANGGALPGDQQLAVVEVDVMPAQPAHLTAVADTDADADTYVNPKSNPDGYTTTMSIGVLNDVNIVITAGLPPATKPGPEPADALMTAEALQIKNH